MFQVASQVTGAAPPAPNDINMVGETVMGLGLAGFMLAGFLVIIALVITVPLFVAWFRRNSDDSESKSARGRVNRHAPRYP